MSQQSINNPLLSSLLLKGAAMRNGMVAIDHTALHDAFVSARLLVPIDGAERAAPGRLSQLTLLTMDNGSGRSLPVFTDDAAARLFFGNERQGLFIMDGRELCRTAVRAGLDSIVINPSGPAGYSMPSHEFGPLAEGLAHRGGGTLEAQAGASIQIGPYTILPIDPDELRQIRSAVRRAEVGEGYWTWARFGGGEPRVVLAVPAESVDSVKQILGSDWSGKEVYVLPSNDGSGVAEEIKRIGQLID